jgi:hypothetical protein
MRTVFSISTLLVLCAVSACDNNRFAAEDSLETAVADEAVVKIAETIDVLSMTKSSGTIVYQGGSIGVEVPRLLEHYYTQTGSLAIRGTLSEPIPSGRTGGASFAVTFEAEQAFSGKTINIKIVSSAAEAGEAFLTYSTNEVGNSGWVAFPVTTDDSVATITYQVPPMSAGLGDFIGIDPNGNELTIKAIVVDVEG